MNENMKVDKNKIYNEKEILKKLNSCLDNTDSYLIIDECDYSIMISKKALDNLKLANILPENFDFNRFLIDCIDDLKFEGVEDYGFEENWANDSIKKNIENNQMYRLYSENSGSILREIDENSNIINGNGNRMNTLLNSIFLNDIMSFNVIYSDFEPLKLNLDGVLYTQVKT